MWRLERNSISCVRLMYIILTETTACAGRFGRNVAFLQAGSNSSGTFNLNTSLLCPFFQPKLPFLNPSSPLKHPDESRCLVISLRKRPIYLLDTDPSIFEFDRPENSLRGFAIITNFPILRQYAINVGDLVFDIEIH